MKNVLRANLQNFTRSLNKEILYALETMSWHDDPNDSVAFGEWGIELIHTLSKNTDLIPYTRGFTRDIYKFMLNADLRMENYTYAVRHWNELKVEMQRHFEFYQSVLSNSSEIAKFNDRQIRNMQDYTQEFIERKQNDILELMKNWHGEEKYNQFTSQI